MCWVPQQSLTSAGKTKGSAIPFLSHNLGEINLPPHPGWQHPHCHCSPLHSNTVSASTSLSKPLHFIAAAAFLRQTFEQSFRRLSLSTSVDVARNNHRLLPALVTTCSHTLLFSINKLISQQQHHLRFSLSNAGTITMSSRHL